MEKIKLINSKMPGERIRKSFFIVYKEYKYLNEIFYCVKPHRNQNLGCKYIYLEKKTGRRVLFDRCFELLSDKEFKKGIRKLLTRSARERRGESLHVIIDERLKD